MKNVLLLLVIAVISGCVGVASVNPVGTEAVKLDPAKWDGVWSDGNESIYFVKVKDAEKGVLHIGYVNEKDGTFEMKTFDANIRSSNKEKFCNIKVSEILDGKDLQKCSDKLQNSYYWLLLKNKKENLTIILPNADKIGINAKEGNIKTNMTNDTLLMEGTSEDVTKFIQSYKNGELYIWKNPMVLQRIMKK